MKFSTLLTLASALVSYAAADCSYIGGNYYCDETTKFIYKNVGFSGSYRDVTLINDSTGATSYDTYSFSGDMAPFDEELSVHFRGPLKLSQFGVYYPASSSNSKRDEVKRDDDSEDCSTTQHVHHKHTKRAVAYVTETRFVNKNGEVVTSSTPAAAATTTTVAAAVSSAAAASSAAESSASASSSSTSASSGDWVRSSYYTPGTGSNVTFLNNYGGSGSGVFSTFFGNSLSYANSDNTGGSSSSTVLGDVTITSNSEFVIFSGEECSGSACGYYRPGIPAYHGFSGAQKMFVFEFQMPTDGSTSFNGDMPAIWLLNAKIPRTGQYSSISCWTSGCGELDLFEVLTSGYKQMTTCLHDKQGGSGKGSSDYITRPEDSTMKAVVVFDTTEVHIMVVDDSTSFDSVLSQSTVDEWLSQTGTSITLDD